ncbi:MAG: AIR synthase-related protein [Bacillota bacterium]|nr:AIR synthase-related protein [Bacillota bacterium]
MASKEGKLSNERLGQLLKESLHPIRNDILLRPAVGEDCAAINFGDRACVVTTDPITAAEAHHGVLAVRVCLNDLASAGATGIGLLLTILAPPETTDEEIVRIMVEAADTARENGAEIIGGHTERTAAVNRLIVSATAIGSAPKSRVISTGGAQPGDLIYMTKYAAIEGTFIGLSIEGSKPLGASDPAGAESRCLLTELEAMLSVVPEGLAAAEAGASALHDATEGGILGAAHELCEASGVGCRIDADRIPLLDETARLAAAYRIDPLKLIASGSMIIAISPDRSEQLESSMRERGILLTRIGVCTEHAERTVIRSGEEKVLDPPQTDEIYRLLERTAGSCT